MGFWRRQNNGASVPARAAKVGACTNVSAGLNHRGEAGRHARIGTRTSIRREQTRTEDHDYLGANMRGR